MNFGSMWPAFWAMIIFGFQSSSRDVRVKRMASDWYEVGNQTSGFAALSFCTSAVSDVLFAR